MKFGFGLILATTFAFAAELPEECKPPASSAAAVRDNPSAKVFETAGAWFAEQGDLRCAQAAFEEAVRLEPHSAAAHYNLGIARVRAQRLPAAAEEFLLALRYKPDMTLAHTSLGTVFLDMQRPAEAAAEFREVLRLDPNSVFALDHLAQQLAAERRFSAAIRYWKRALALQPNSPEMVRPLRSAHFGLGKTYAQEGRLREAAGEYAEAFGLDGQQDAALLAKAQALAAIPAFQDALADAREYVQREPADPEGHLLLGSVYRGLGDEGSAEAELKLAGRASQPDKLKATQLAAKGNQANQLLQARQPARAAGVYREMLAIDPGNARTEYSLALALDAAHDPKGERAALERALRLDPKMAVAQGELGRLDLAAGNTALAEKRFEAAIAGDPQLVSAVGNLGMIRAKKGDTEGAEKLFREAIEDDPDYQQGHLHLGLLLAQRQKFTEAEVEVDQALKLAPGDVAALAAAGKVKARLGRSEGVALLRKVVSLSPQSATAHLDLGLVLAESHDLPGALAETGEAVRLAPESAAARFNHGRVLYDLGRNVEAQPDFESACRIAPKMAEPYYYLALVEKQAGRYQHAVTLLQTVVKLQPRNADAWHLLGQCLEHESQTQAAIAAWRQAVAIEPDYSQALWSLARAVKAADPDEAARLTARYSEVQRKRRIVDQAGTLGNDALEAGAAHDWPEAIRQFHKALEVCGDCAIKADLHKKLGLINCQMGDIESGEKELRLAQALKPADPDIEPALRRIAAARAQRAASHPGSEKKVP